MGKFAQLAARGRGPPFPPRPMRRAGSGGAPLAPVSGAARFGGAADRGAVGAALGSSAVIAASVIVGDPVLAYVFSVTFLLVLIVAKASMETQAIAAILLVATPVNLLTPVPISIALTYVLAARVHAKVRRVFSASRYIRYGAGLLLIGFLLSIPGWGADDYSLLQAKNFVLYVGLMWVVMAFLAVVFRGPRMALFVAAYVVVAVTALIAVAEIFGTTETVFTDQFGDLAGVIMLGKVPFIMRRTILGPMVGTLAVASFALLIASPTFWVVALFSGCMVVNLYFLTMGASVGSMVSTALAVLAVAGLAARGQARRTARRVLLLVGATAFLAVYQSGVLEGLMERSSARVVSHASTVGTTGGDRYPLWANGLQTFSENPFGSGWPRQGLTNITGDGLGPHNDYILYSIMYGAIGAAGYILAVVGAAVKAARSALLEGGVEARAVSLVGAGSAIVFVINSITDYLVADPWYFAVMWTLMALGLVPGLQHLVRARMGATSLSGKTIA